MWPPLPTKRTEEDKQKRIAMFDSFDPNGNGYLSLAECDKGVFDLGWQDCPKPVLMRAFQAAKGVAQRHGSTDTTGESFIERPEFRLFLLYLDRYSDLWGVFSSLDSEADRRIDEAEFLKGISLMQSSWGVEIADPGEEFKKIDTNSGGKVLFDEFAAWALPLALSNETGEGE